MLIDDIIGSLSDEGSSLSEALLKTKVLLHQIGKRELADWVTHELNGYPDDAALPNYRVLQSQVVANVANIALRAEAHPIPISHLKPEMRENIEMAQIRQSLSIVEEISNSSKESSGYLARAIPMEFNAILSKGLANGFRVERAWCQTPVHDLKGILTQVRSRLLDFLLELRESIGTINDEKSVREKVASVDANSMFNSAIFGSNTTIIVGDRNQQTISLGTVKGDLEALTQFLSNIGIPHDEVEGLRAAVAEDKINGGSPSFEGKTGHWFTRLMGRAATGAISVGSDVFRALWGRLLQNT